MPLPDIIAAMPATQKIVIIADTHIGDRSDQLEPSLFEAIRAEAPDQIFHAGDVCKPEVIEQLETIAPTAAVQGNRDWFLGYKLPKEIKFTINGLKIVLAHGHFSIWHWFWNYVYLFLTRKMHDHIFFQKKLARCYPDADVIVYGHLHFPYDEKMDGKRFLNPGVCYPEWRNNFRPAYLVLTVFPDGSYTTGMRITSPDRQKNV